MPARTKSFSMFIPTPIRLFSDTLRLYFATYVEGLEIIFPNSQQVDCYSQAKTLVLCQKYIFKSLNVKSPKWNGNHLLSLKEMEHGLCDYSKYVRIKNLKKRRIRSYRPSETKIDAQCHNCKSSGPYGNFCDTCRLYYCNECDSCLDRRGHNVENGAEQATSFTDDLELTTGSWICQLCKDFQSISFES